MQVLVRANDFKIDDMVENLRVTTENLDQLTDTLKQRPWSMIRIKQPKERTKCRNQGEMSVKQAFNRSSVLR